MEMEMEMEMEMDANDLVEMGKTLNNLLEDWFKKVKEKAFNTGQRIGYIRVSTFEQNLGSQLLGVKLDKTFSDKISGKDIDRPGLNDLVDYARAGDTIVIDSMDRLARNAKQLLIFVDTMTDKKINVFFVKEDRIYTGDDSPLSKFMLTTLGGYGEFGRNNILERQKEGIALARSKKIYKGGPFKLSADQTIKIKERIKAGEKQVDVANHFGVTRQTIYKYLKRF